MHNTRARKLITIATAVGIWFSPAAVSARPGQARTPPAQPSPTNATLAIVGGYLIDGHNGPPVNDAVILIDGKKIVAVGTKDSLKAPAGVKVIDASGYTVMPGLMNAHVHLDLIGHSDYDEWHHKHVAGTADYMRVCEVAARQLLMGGVTTAVDLAGDPQTLSKIRERINSGQLPGPRMIMSMGWIWHTTPEVAAANHRGTYTFNVHGAQEARAAAIKTIEMGADIIKLWNGSTAEEVKAVVEEAHKKRLKVTGHSSGDQDTLARIAAGQDGIEHNGFNVDNPEVIRSLLDHRTVVDPTPIQSLAAYNAINWPPFADNPRARLLTPPDLWSEIRGSLDHFERLPYFGGWYQPERYDRAAKTVKKLYDSGVRLVMGTDSGTPSNYHVDNTWHQMQLYTRFGIPAMDVIAMATRISAQWLGLGATTGTIEPGRMADIIVVDGNPLTDMSALKDPVYVLKEGVQYKGPAATLPATKTTSAAQR